MMKSRPTGVIGPATVIAILGAIVMGALAFEFIWPPRSAFMGTRLYDLYAAALLEGRFDLPLRELHLEGHHTPDGTGYLYHGLGPILTRLPFAAFVDLPAGWIAPLSIWLWSIAGNVGYHAAFLVALAGPGNAPVRGSIRTALSALIWFGAPGIVLCANGAFFYEPVAMAYALGGGFVLVLAKVVFGRISVQRALVPMAVLAGLALHARPHLAVGLYLTTSVLAAWSAWRGGRKACLGAGLALAIMGAFGASLILSNAARFGTPITMHGSFAKSEVQYGWFFWDAESQTSERALGFEKYGQFNARRIPANTLMYVAAPPPLGPARVWRERLEDIYRTLGPAVRYTRIEEPNVGTAFLWPVWMLLMVVGFASRWTRTVPVASGIAGAATGGLMMLSYATITFRYHVDLWPLIALPAVFGAGPATTWLMDATKRRACARSATALLGIAGIAVTLLTIGHSRTMLQERPGMWTRDFCLQLTARKGFDQHRRDELCAEGSD